MNFIPTEKTWTTYFWARYNGRRDIWSKGDVPEELKEGELYLVEKVTQGRSWTKYFIRELPENEGINSVVFEPIKTFFTEGFPRIFVPKKGECLENFKRRAASGGSWQFIEKTSPIEEITQIGNLYRVITKNSCYII